MDGIKNSEASRDLLIAEFSNLRQEQFARTNAQQVLVNLNVTAAVTLGAIAVASDKPLILLILPLMSFALGLTYYGQDRSILLIGGYIDDVVRPLAQDLGDPKVFQFERHVRLHERGRTIRMVMTLDMIIVFPGVGLLALLFSSSAVFGSTSTIVPIVTWIAELGLEILLVILWIPAAQRLPLRRRSQG